jgi:hypothetical protein
LTHAYGFANMFTDIVKAARYWTIEDSCTLF